MRILSLVGFLSLPAMAACGSAPQTGDPPATEAPPAVRTSHAVQQGNVTIEVIAEGSGPLMVLLPSLGRDVTEFDPLAERLRAAGFRVVRPRPRGFGRSVGPMEGLTLHDFARDTAAVVEHERAGLAIMVGHAYGHFVAKMTASIFRTWCAEWRSSRPARRTSARKCGGGTRLGRTRPVRWKSAGSTSRWCSSRQETIRLPI